MALLSTVPLAQATAFTLGCIVLDSRRIDVERAGAVLTAVAAFLLLVLLIGATPANTPDSVGIDPDEVHSILE